MTPKTNALQYLKNYNAESFVQKLLEEIFLTILQQQQQQNNNNNRR